MAVSNVEGWRNPIDFTQGALVGPTNVSTFDITDPRNPVLLTTSATNVRPALFGNGGVAIGTGQFAFGGTRAGSSEQYSAWWTRGIRRVRNRRPLLRRTSCVQCGCGGAELSVRADRQYGACGVPDFKLAQLFLSVRYRGRVGVSSAQSESAPTPPRRWSCPAPPPAASPVGQGSERRCRQSIRK